MPRILVLAKNSREAGSYAALVGLETRSYRAVNKAAGIRGIRNAEIHILPSFLERVDRHAIIAELRWARAEVFYVDPTDFAAPPESAPDPASGPAPSVVDLKQSMADELDDDDEVQAQLDEKPAPKPKPRAKQADADSYFN